MRTWLLVIICSVLGLVYIFWQNQFRENSRIVFCDVGQGDAIYLRLSSPTDVLIDAGANNKVVGCLNSELPYFDRKIEIMFLTHPEHDHFGGLNYLLDSFTIETLYLPISVKNNLPKDNELWDQVWQKTKKRVGEIQYLGRGDKLAIDNDEFWVVWPKYFDSASENEIEQNGFNNIALGLLALVREKELLLLSDLDLAPAESAIEELNLAVDIFKVNHHGSKYGISQKLLELADPQLAVISVGKNNWYGHPHPETIELLQSLDIPIKRTDQQGKIVIPL